MLCISAAYAVVRCLSVCPSVRPSVTFVYCVGMSKHIFQLFSPLYSHIVLAFSIPNLVAIFRRRPPNWSFECTYGMKNSYFRPIYRVISKIIQDSAIVFMIAMFKLFYNTITVCQRPVGPLLSNKCM